MEYLARGGVLGARAENSQLVGYLLYAKYERYFRIAHLCIREEHRGLGIARRLIEDLKQSANSQKLIKLHCRRDFLANEFWPALGFVPVCEKPGRSLAKHPLTLWCLTLAQDDPLGLFQAQTSDETIDVIIDAQIFFDFFESDSDKSKPSKALLSDFLIDSLKLWVTDELLVEIERNDDQDQRASSRRRARELSTIECDPKSVDNFEAVLRNYLPSRSPNEKSDIRHLAKSAASHANIFVTRDGGLLRKAKTILDHTNLEVLSPTKLIIDVHELSERQTYGPVRISGSHLEWRRMASSDLASFPYASFLCQGERQGPFSEKLNSFLARPDVYEVELLCSNNEIIGFQIVYSNANRILVSPLSRVAHSSNQALFERFMISNTINRAIERKLGGVKLQSATGTKEVGSAADLLEMGFTKCSDGFIRFCFADCKTRDELLARISEICSESTDYYGQLSVQALERKCSPVSLNACENLYMMPILPGFALSLFDIDQSGRDLFGGDTSVLLRWENVYYKRKTHHIMLKSPGRILWYVSAPRKEVVAVSHLDAVEIGSPKQLLRKFKKIGILDWTNLFEMCEGDISRELMALKFSHSFPFRKPISLNALRNIAVESETSLVLQSPSRVSAETFQNVLRHGFSDSS